MLCTCWKAVRQTIFSSHFLVCRQSHCSTCPQYLSQYTLTFNLNAYTIWIYEPYFDINCVVKDIKYTCSCVMDFLDVRNNNKRSQSKCPKWSNGLFIVIVMRIITEHMTWWWWIPKLLVATMHWFVRYPAPDSEPCTACAVHARVRFTRAKQYNCYHDAGCFACDELKFNYALKLKLWSIYLFA